MVDETAQQLFLVLCTTVWLCGAACPVSFIDAPGSFVMGSLLFSLISTLSAKNGLFFSSRGNTGKGSRTSPLVPSRRIEGMFFWYFSMSLCFRTSVWTPHWSPAEGAGVEGRD